MAIHSPLCHHCFVSERAVQNMEPVNCYYYPMVSKIIFLYYINDAANVISMHRSYVRPCVVISRPIKRSVIRNVIIVFHFKSDIFQIVGGSFSVKFNYPMCIDHCVYLYSNLSKCCHVVCKFHHGPPKL